MNQHRGAERGSSGNNQVSLVPRCTICTSSYDLNRNRTINRLICRTCTQRIKRERELTPGQVRARSHKIIGYVICHVFARRGFKAARGVAIKLLDILDA